MIRTKVSVTVNRPLEEVWRYLADVERHPEWTDMTVSRRLDEGPLQVGSRVYGQVALGPFKPGWTYEVRELEPMRRFVYRTVAHGALSMDGVIEVVAEGQQATRIDNQVDVMLHGPLRLAEPLLRAEIRRNEEAETARLKEKLESGAATEATGEAQATANA
jgi:uncharacterized protein YndB with AHSA1/START domain